ncbi:MAG: hypothetical protein ACRD0G_15830, partial [Acidimicrobiales bacterium]
MSGREPPRRGVAFDILNGLADRVPGASIAKGGLEAAERVVDRVPALAWMRGRIAEVEHSALQT